MKDDDKRTTTNKNNRQTPMGPEETYAWRQSGGAGPLLIVQAIGQSNNVGRPCDSRRMVVGLLSTGSRMAIGRPSSGCRTSSIVGRLLDCHQTAVERVSDDHPVAVQRPSSGHRQRGPRLTPGLGDWSPASPSVRTTTNTNN